MKDLSRANNPYGDDKVTDACSLFGMMNLKGKRFSSRDPVKAIANMHDRGNGLGGGFAVYGLYPEFKDDYAFHIMYMSKEAKEKTETLLNESFDVIFDEKVPTREAKIRDPPLVWRYFVQPGHPKPANQSADDYMVEKVMRINTETGKAFVFSSGKDMGVFKGVGFPEDIAEYFCLEEYLGYMWICHGRFPTNTPGWWGGAHPFNILDWTVVHNGEISSYGINRRYLEMYGYKCTMQTDTEVMAYAFDLLMRRQGLPIEVVSKILAPPLWIEVDTMGPEHGHVLTSLRQTYGSLLMNGPFAVIVAHHGEMIGLTDRIKLRPLSAGVRGDFFYISSEESAMRLVSPMLDRTWSPRGGEPVVGRLGNRRVVEVLARRVLAMKSYLSSEYIVERDQDRCIRCEVCINQCTYETHYYDAEDDIVHSRNENCTNCQRCVVFCPTQAITIRKNSNYYRENANWTQEAIAAVKKQAETGSIILTGMGCDKPHLTYWDRLLLNASQVTNPSIDPLREPMELRTYLGAKPDRLEMETEEGNIVLKTKLAPQLSLEAPILFSAISYGSTSIRVHESLARAASEFGTLFNTGEGGLDRRLYKHGGRTIVQVASGRFGVHPEYLDVGAAIEIKIGQGAKPGIGGHLPGEKVSEDISKTRMIPPGTDALSPAPQHDVYSIEDLRQLIYALKEATNYTKPVFVKIAAVHNSAAIASGMVRAGADVIALDGVRGGTGAAPRIIRDNVGIPIELAIASVDQRLREEGIRNSASIIAAGGIKSSAEVVKAIALGADAVYIATAALVAMGCTVCQKCYTGKCPWGIATTDSWISKRINPDIAAKRLVNLLRGWSLEIKEMMGGMGINAIESLRGNRLHLRGVGLTDTELRILGVRMAGD